ncbi:hypothetical protein [Streptomyces sp. enrichment culture]|uniref:hypothetical protein n=1 Tax=Streptomyces sp. enrichment culture TaxID=1795815 RepID=UPI003F564568
MSRTSGVRPSPSEAYGSESGSASSWRHSESTRPASASSRTGAAVKSRSHGPPQRGQHQVSEETED